MTTNDKLLDEYSAIAADYDRRWHEYLDKSLGMTLGNVADLRTDRVLDVGCGTGKFLEILARQSGFSELVGIDKVSAMIAVARRRLGQRATLLQSDAAQLPFRDAYFDLVICTSALHYFTSVDATLRRIRRVILPHGNLIITDWCRDYVWMKLLNRILPTTRHAHVHTFSVAELEYSLVLNDFRVLSATKKKIDWFWGLMSVHAVPV